MVNITLICIIPYQLCMTMLLYLSEPDANELLIIITLVEVARSVMLYIFTYKKNGYRLLLLDCACITIVHSRKHF